MKNRNFEKVQRQIQDVLPHLGIFVIIAVYIVTAVSMGNFFHMRMSTAGALPYFIAYGTGFGTQLTRAYIVFNSQISYGNPQSSTFAYLFGALLTVYTGMEAYHLASDYFVSILHIVGSGYIVEILYLRHLDTASAYQLTKDPTLLNEFIEFERRQRELRDFMKGEDNYDKGKKNGVDFDYEAEEVPFEYSENGKHK